ncbi:MAG: twin-arginine translocase TatA/TatE family subunit [bacterium]|nr:twin-arginine translocase TatA/TatE family subunit [bacterium]
MFGLGAPEMILIFLAILLLFGAKRLPELAKGLGQGIREFKRAMKETSEEVKGSVDARPQDPNRIEPPRDDKNAPSH